MDCVLRSSCEDGIEGYQPKHVLLCTPLFKFGHTKKLAAKRLIFGRLAVEFYIRMRLDIVVIIVGSAEYQTTYHDV